MLDGKDYFVITTNVDHQFQLAGFDIGLALLHSGRLRVVPVLAKLLEQDPTITRSRFRQMVAEQKGMKIPVISASEMPRLRSSSGAEPACRRELLRGCGMARSLESAIRTSGKSMKAARCSTWNRRWQQHACVIMKYPFWDAVKSNSEATYACVNRAAARSPRAIADRSILIDGDIGTIISASLHR